MTPRLPILSSLRARLFGEPGVVPLSYFPQFLPGDPVIVEAGAHNGSDTLRIARAWPNGHVHAFEPVPDLFGQLTARVGALPNVSCHPVALSDFEGSATIFVSSGASDGSSSLLRPTGHLSEHPKVAFNREISIPVTTLECWAAERELALVDFLWLDLQGGELRALKGAGGLLAQVRLVYSEVSLKPMYEDAPLYPELRSWMESAGFRVVREELPWPDMGNVVFARI